MQKFFAVLALLAAAAPTPLLARDAAQRFTRDGVTYVYIERATASGRTVIEGRRLPSGSAFRLIVSGERVSGVSGGQPVSFRVPRNGAVEVAAR